MAPKLAPTNTAIVARATPGPSPCVTRSWYMEARERLTLFMSKKVYGQPTHFILLPETHVDAVCIPTAEANTNPLPSVSMDPGMNITVATK